MASGIIHSVKLVMRYKKGSYTFTQVKKGAGDDALYELGDALASLQDEKPKQIVKVVTRHM